MQSTTQWWTHCILVSLFVSLAMYGCGTDDEDSTPRITPTPRIDATLLRRWTLASIERADGTVVTSDTPYTYTVTFTQEKISLEQQQILGIREALQLSLRDGCNSCSGGYTIGVAGFLSISIDGCTLVLCLPPPALANLFIGALSNASSYEVGGNTLRIGGIDGASGARLMLHFSAN